MSDDSESVVSVDDVVVEIPHHFTFGNYGSEDS